MDRILGGGIILKRQGWLVDMRWGPFEPLPTVSIKRAGSFRFPKKETDLRPSECKEDSQRS